MSAVRITKEQVEEAARARKAKLETDPEFQALEEERKRFLEEAPKRLEEEGS